MQAIHLLNNFIKNNNHLSNEVKNVSRLLLANQQGGPLAQLTVKPEQPTILGVLRPIVVHTASLMLCLEKWDILLPLMNIIKDPSMLIVSCSTH